MMQIKRKLTFHSHWQIFFQNIRNHPLWVTWRITYTPEFYQEAISHLSVWWDDLFCFTSHILSLRYPSLLPYLPFLPPSLIRCLLLLHVLSLSPFLLHNALTCLHSTLSPSFVISLPLSWAPHVLSSVVSLSPLVPPILCCLSLPIPYFLYLPP